MEDQIRRPCNSVASCPATGTRPYYVPAPDIPRRRVFSIFPKRTIPELRRIRPDIVIAAELGPRTIHAALYAFAHRIPLVCYLGGNAAYREPHSGLEEPGASLVAARADAFWVNGTESAQYVRDLGVPDDCVYPSMTGVDTSYFLHEAAAWYDKREIERQRQGLSGTVFVCSCSLSARKGILAYLAAMRRMLELAPDAKVSFLFIGDGEHRADVEAFARQHPRVACGHHRFRAAQ